MTKSKGKPPEPPPEKVRSARSEEYKRRNRGRRTGKRSFEMASASPPVVQVTKRSVDVTETVRRRIQENASAIAARLTPFEFKFILQLYFGDQGCVGWRAMKRLRPWVTDKSATEKASEYLRAIRKKIGEEGIHEIIGFTVDHADFRVAGALDAKLVREFLNTRTGAITVGNPYDDHPTQLNAAKLVYTRKGVLKDPDGAGPLVVNIVQYNPPGTPKWPGGGRGDDPPPHRSISIPYQAVPAALPAAKGDRDA